MWWRRALRPFRRALGRFVILPEPEDGVLVGEHGCLNAAASFITWNQVEGDYLEFGVYRGRSFVAAYRAIHANRARHRELMATRMSDEYRSWSDQRPRFFAFDSFRGLPEGSSERHVDFAAGDYQCSQQEFEARLAAQGVDRGDVIVVPGFFSESLNAEVKKRHQLRRAALVLVDSSLYESAAAVLSFLTDIVGQGTIIIFHNWFRYLGSPERGEQRAAREWLVANPHLELVEYWREGPQAVSFLVNLRASRPPGLHIEK